MPTFIPRSRLQGRGVEVQRAPCERRRRIALSMRAAGWPVGRIARALGMKRRRVRAVLSGSALWSGQQIALFREAA